MPTSAASIASGVTYAVAAGNESWHKARLILSSFDAKGRWIPGAHLVVALVGDHPWKRYAEVFQVIPEAEELRASIQLARATGTVWVRALSLREAMEKPLYVFVQAGVFVKRFGATTLVGWGAGYSVLREIGPILIGLMFSGRVGSNNTAELGTMTVTEQIDGLRALAIDPISYLVAPRVVAMMAMLLALTVIGDLVAIAGAALFGRLLLNIEFGIFFQSFQWLGLADVTHGLVKATVFGGIIALTSCHFGISVRGGAVGVGRSVNAAVVASALGIVISDYFLTFLMT